MTTQTEAFQEGTVLAETSTHMYVAIDYARGDEVHCLLPWVREDGSLTRLEDIVEENPSVAREHVKAALLAILAVSDSGIPPEGFNTPKGVDAWNAAMGEELKMLQPYVAKYMPELYA